ncbi:MAG: single-stranded DNA-binding protein [Acidobacteria bacterium]|nr:single-stranded DNA-binding protein [Acidobacteriota bacterium]
MARNRKYTVESVAPKIDSFLNDILKHSRLRLSFEIGPGATPHPEIEDPEVVVRFSGADMEILLENKAELLLALEHLTMEMLRMPSEDHSLLCFDANDYRLLRIEELRLAAITAAEKVKRTRAPFQFNPMSSRERRVIHLALRGETAVRSESTGTGSYRQVVILPADMPMPAPHALAGMSDQRRGRRR